MIEALKVYLDDLESAVGGPWLKQQVEFIRDTDPRHRIGAVVNRRGKLIHPLAVAWLAAREELVAAEITGTARFSGNTLKTAGIGHVLTLCSGREGFDLIKKRFMDKCLFERACCELYVASALLKNGRAVKFAPPDIIVCCGDELIVRCFLVNSADSIGLEINPEGFMATAGNQGKALVAWLNSIEDLQHSPGPLRKESSAGAIERAVCGLLDFPQISAVVSAEFKKPKGSEILHPEKITSLALNQFALHPLSPDLKTSLLRPGFFSLIPPALQV